MAHRSQLEGVATWVLRPRGNATEVLLLAPPAAAAEAGGAPEWGPVRGEVGAEETEAAAAMRSFQASTGLVGGRVYASPVAVFAPGPGLARVGVFVAILPEAAEPEPGAVAAAEGAWLPLREAAERLTRAHDRASLAEVEARFVKGSPDEALRVG